jgi:dTDP-4-dehydrorhamnose reductase
MTDHCQLQSMVREINPTGVVHAAGMCDLDLGEKCPQMPYERNVLGTEKLLEVLTDCYVMYVSADLVFSGENCPKDGYSETDSPDPVSVIGKTYLQAEEVVQNHESYGIVRIGLPMGPSIQGKKGPVDFICKRLRAGKPMTLFYDELRSAIHTDDLARGLAGLFEKKVQGLFHLGGPQPVSLYAMGEQLVSQYSYDEKNLIRASRFEDKINVPRIGNVHLNSKKANDLLGYKASPWLRVSL